MPLDLFGYMVAGALVVGGLGMAVVFIVAKDDDAAERPARPSALSARFKRVTPRAWLRVAAGLVAGVVVWQVTGLVVLLLAVPLGVVGLPWLLSGQGPKHNIERLEAMADWTRSLAGILHVGVGLEEALASSIRSTPTAIQPEVARLVARLRARWNTQDAIRAFADDLDDPTGDLIAMNLILASQRRGRGLSDVLESLAATVGDDVRNRRQIEADRAKPRSTARWVTLITITVLAGLALSGTYVDPYRTPLGQVILTVLLGAFVLCLLWFKRIAAGTPTPRILGSRR
ncbi:type II secretion system F family protein [Xylanimonas protaetiae]|uniref:Type II secretion system protein GspF domain-containing protein n=1 Tax=Xylanimonas protaetiae TaxID=2509457 RepID=A0A4P6F815_9MICO|nr:type II secretion system F family protein [Xylanimonas protaetiae]QAY71626.1 hypothetical protein ET471_17605 [Xylanimonas protaetiae]